MNHEPGVYVARYGWDRRSADLTTGSAVFVLTGLIVPMSLALRVVAIVFFGGCALAFAAVIATRRVALQVDSNGVTLGGSPGRFRPTVCLTPWADIHELVLWRKPMPHGGSMRYITVERRNPVPARNKDGMLLASRAVNLWRLDTDQLTAAVSLFAPCIAVIDNDTGSGELTDSCQERQKRAFTPDLAMYKYTARPPGCPAAIQAADGYNERLLSRPVMHCHAADGELLARWAVCRLSLEASRSWPANVSWRRAR